MTLRAPQLGVAETSADARLEGGEIAFEQLAGNTPLTLRARTSQDSMVGVVTIYGSQHPFSLVKRSARR